MLGGGGGVLMAVTVIKWVTGGLEALWGFPVLGGGCL